ncbi:hypothetical protein CEXT_173271 [Caerostris extrusa]|uniref:Uncharacterized protein n=1 Tax=Caerostris extrusa TaxID=172846 RepID=A0AAV4VV67_CAEEX|nr:hypothetical protein CEXT_173271 [Caerostris extrusa]
MGDVVLSTINVMLRNTSYDLFSEDGLFPVSLRRVLQGVTSIDLSPDRGQTLVNSQSGSFVFGTVSNEEASIPISLEFQIHV